MEKFIYQKGITTSDDIIEYLLMRLSTDYSNSALQVNGFCITADAYESDHNMVKKVIAKMLKHNVAKNSTGEGQDEWAIESTAKGIEVYENKGWKQYIENYEKEQFENKKQKTTPSILVNGNAVIGNNNKENTLNQGRLNLGNPTDAPTKLPTTNDNQQKHKQVEMSTAQFIIWIFTAFSTGITIGFAIAKTLQH